MASFTASSPDGGGTGSTSHRAYSSVNVLATGGTGTKAGQSYPSLAVDAPSMGSRSSTESPYPTLDPTEPRVGTRDERLDSPYPSAPVLHDAISGAVIPTAFFRKAEGRALDQNGDPIPSGLYVLALDNFATAGPVDDDGYFEIYLLKQSYTDFILIGDSDPSQQEGYDLVWYEMASNPTLSSREGYIELEFDVQKPKPPDDGPAGLDISSSVRFG